MNKLLLGASALFLSVNVFGQTPIQANVIKPSIGETFTLAYGDYISPGSPGMNQTWDLRGIENNTAVTVNILSTTVSNSDFKIQYVGASVMDVKMDNGYKILRMETLTNPTTTMVMSPAMVNYALPIVYGSTGANPFATNYSVAGSSLSRTGEISYAVDGFGSLITPSGTFTDVYRIQIIQEIVDNYEGMEMESRIEMYSWIKAGYHHELAMVQYSTTLSGDVSNGCYLVTSPNLSTSDINQAAVSLYPNPTTSNFSLRSEEMITNVIVTDINGRMVIELANIDKTLLDINTTEWESGVYFVSTKTNSGSQLMKLIKE